MKDRLLPLLVASVILVVFSPTSAYSNPITLDFDFTANGFFTFPLGPSADDSTPPVDSVSGSVVLSYDPDKFGSTHETLTSINLNIDGFSYTTANTGYGYGPGFVGIRGGAPIQSTVASSVGSDSFVFGLNPSTVDPSIPDHSDPILGPLGISTSFSYTTSTSTGIYIASSVDFNVPPVAGKSASKESLAKMANGAYDADNHDSRETGFTEIPGTRTPNTAVFGEKGFSGAAFANSDNSEVVVAFAGTDSGQDVFADLVFLDTNGTLTPGIREQFIAQLGSAAQLLESVRSDPRYAEAKITVTGHSLGGALAQLIGHGAGERTVTYNAPGVSLLLNDEGVTSIIYSLDPGLDPGNITNLRLQFDQASFVGSDLLGSVLGTGHIGDVSTILDASIFLEDIKPEIAISKALFNHGISSVISALDAEDAVIVDGFDRRVVTSEFSVAASIAVIAVGLETAGTIAIPIGEALSPLAEGGKLAHKTLIDSLITTGKLTKGVGDFILDSVESSAAAVVDVTEYAFDKTIVTLEGLDVNQLGTLALLLDPPPGNGFILQTGLGDPNFASVIAPFYSPDIGFKLDLFNGGLWETVADILHSDPEYFFGPGGVDIFGLRPFDFSLGAFVMTPDDFVPGVRFVDSGQFTGSITSINFSDLPVDVPEPSTVALLGLGLAGLCWSRRKKA